MPVETDFCDLYQWASLPSSFLLGLANGENLPEIKSIPMDWPNPLTKDLSSQQEALLQHSHSCLWVGISGFLPF